MLAMGRDAPALARASARSLPGMFTWAGTHSIATSLPHRKPPPRVFVYLPQGGGRVVIYVMRFLAKHEKM